MPMEPMDDALTTWLVVFVNSRGVEVKGVGGDDVALALTVEVDDEISTTAMRQQK